MKIGKKIMIGFLGVVAIFAMFGYSIYLNEKSMESATSKFSDEIIIELNTLQELKSLSLIVLSSTMGTVLIMDERIFMEQQQQIENELEIEKRHILQGKANFENAFDLLYDLTSSDLLELDNTNNIEKEWNVFLVLSEELIKAKESGVGGSEILELKEKFEDAETNLLKSIDDALWHEFDEVVEHGTIIDSSFSTNFQIIIWGVLLVVMLSIITGLAISKSITKPIVKLKKVVNNITKGDFDQKIDITSKDEIGELASQFDVMKNSIKKSNEALSSSEKKYRDLYENSPALHRTINTDGIILDCNNSYAKRFGYTKDEIIGSTIFKFMADDNKDALRKSFETWKKYGTVHNREVWFKTKDGKTFPALISSNNLYDKEAKLIGSNTIIREITDYYRAKKARDEKKEAQNKIEELKKIDLLKEEFSSMLSHELKTPLLPIIGFCELLKEPSTIKKLDKVEIDNIDEILSNSRQLEKLVKDVLDVQKLDMNQLTFNKEKFSVGEFLTELTKEIKSLLSEKQIQFTVHPLEESWLEADRDRLRQVFFNLIKNAVDFVPAKKGKIEIKTQVKDNHIVFCVKDNGIGIPKEKQKDLFKKFYQIDTSLTRKHGGTGLGLVICKGIVEAMGGKIWVESRRGNGIQFYFSIPNLQVKPLVAEH